MDRFKYCPSAKMLFDTQPQNSWIHVTLYKKHLWKNKIFCPSCTWPQQQLGIRRCWALPRQWWSGEGQPHPQPSPCCTWGHGLGNPVTWWATLIAAGWWLQTWRSLETLARETTWFHGSFAFGLKRFFFLVFTALRGLMMQKIVIYKKARKKNELLFPLSNWFNFIFHSLSLPHPSLYRCYLPMVHLALPLGYSPIAGCSSAPSDFCNLNKPSNASWAGSNLLWWPAGLIYCSPFLSIFPCVWCLYTSLWLFWPNSVQHQSWQWAWAAFWDTFCNKSLIV